MEELDGNLKSSVFADKKTNKTKKDETSIKNKKGKQRAMILTTNIPTKDKKAVDRRRAIAGKPLSPQLLINNNESSDMSSDSDQNLVDEQLSSDLFSSGTENNTGKL